MKDCVKYIHDRWIYHCRIIEMRHDLRQDRLCLVTKSIIGRVITMCRQFQRFCELPLEINCQADWNLISSEAEDSLVTIDRNHRWDVHVLGWHFKLILSQSVEATESHAGVGDDRLAGAEQFKIISALEDGTIARGDVQTLNNNQRWGKRNEGKVHTRWRRCSPALVHPQFCSSS